MLITLPLYTVLSQEQHNCSLNVANNLQFNNFYYNASTTTLTIGWTQPPHQNITEYVLDYVRVHSNKSVTHSYTTSEQSIQIPYVDVYSRYYFTLKGISAEGRTDEMMYCLGHSFDISNLTSCKYTCAYTYTSHVWLQPQVNLF